MQDDVDADGAPTCGCRSVGGAHADAAHTLNNWLASALASVQLATQHIDDRGTAQEFLDEAARAIRQAAITVAAL